MNRKFLFIVILLLILISKSYGQQCQDCKNIKILIYDINVQVQSVDTSSLTAVKNYWKLYWIAKGIKDYALNMDTARNCYSLIDAGYFTHQPDSLEQKFTDKKIKDGDSIVKHPRAGNLNLGDSYYLIEATITGGNGLYNVTAKLEAATSREIVKTATIAYTDSQDPVEIGKTLGSQLGPLCKNIFSFGKTKRNNGDSTAIRPFIFLSTDNDQLDFNQSTNIKIKLIDSTDLMPLKNRKIVLNAAYGTLDNTTVTTDNNGEATAQFTSGSNSSIGSISGSYSYRDPSGQMVVINSSPLFTQIKKPSDSWYFLMNYSYYERSTDTKNNNTISSQDDTTIAYTNITHLPFISYLSESSADLNETYNFEEIKSSEISLAAYLYKVNLPAAAGNRFVCDPSKTNVVACSGFGNKNNWSNDISKNFSTEIITDYSEPGKVSNNTNIIQDMEKTEFVTLNCNSHPTAGPTFNGSGIKFGPGVTNGYIDFPNIYGAFQEGAGNIFSTTNDMTIVMSTSTKNGSGCYSSDSVDINQNKCTDGEIMDGFGDNSGGKDTTYTTTEVTRDTSLPGITVITTNITNFSSMVIWDTVAKIGRKEINIHDKSIVHTEMILNSNSKKGNNVKTKNIEDEIGDTYQDIVATLSYTGKKPNSIKYNKLNSSDNSLVQNYPNPFSNYSTIRYHLTAQTSVKLSIYDIYGKEVMTLDNGLKSPGDYDFSVNAEHLSSGIYYYRLETNNGYTVKKMIVLKNH